MAELPATTPPPANSNAVVPHPQGGALAAMKQRSAALWGATRTNLAEGLQHAGAAVESVHRRLVLVIAAMIAILVAGAVFRGLGLPQLNYLLIAVFGIGALYAFLNPVHIAGLLLIGGGVGAVRGVDGVRDALLGYAKLLGRVFLAFLVPLLFFALAPGDRSLGTSLTFLVLAPVAVLVIFLFGRVALRVERAVFVVIPLGALLLAGANMLIPQRMLAAVGVPAWLRADRPQNEELARLETLIEQRRNEQRAAQLHAISAKIEAGEALTAEDEAIVASAQNDRVTLTGWIGRKYDAALAGISERVNARRAAAAQVKAVPSPGSLLAPRWGWSPAVTIPAGFKLCPQADRGEDSYTAQCHLRGKPAAAWYDEASDRCVPADTDSTRFRSRRRAQDIRYRFVATTGSCAAGG
ncbi:MAG: hypothetical protein JWL96_1463 [Sphingomonas bacterium]|uniref:hypothetical protein n=1 Tax=Sphingomonas bacterium TaxID=1895847 RepID=UPI0026312D07|nr:hypothetical protein [Sphingomonas bacterium]MDB5709393.1 hypothetical protein [Sphingomonas bacterium]